jgi:seryl-tRNA synthetase
VFLTTAGFEAVVDGLDTALTAFAGVMSSLRTPPVVARSVIEKSGYDESFPHLLGRVVIGAEETDLVLLPAACYAVYPWLDGVQLTAPTELSVEATCFRQEGSTEIGRLRSFRMRELVRVGAADDCRTWRDDRLARARDWLTELGLATDLVIASDPFFGTGDRLLRAFQQEEKLKIELVATVGTGQAQAVASGNYHKDKFGRLFAIVDPAGGVAHTACLAFGYERLVLALMYRYGDNPDRWPRSVRAMLTLGPQA